MEFKEELKINLIPRVEAMVEKEIIHLKRLKDFKEETSTWFFRVGLSDSEIDSMITVSENSLRHLKIRLKEYIEYANK